MGKLSHKYLVKTSTHCISNPTYHRRLPPPLPRISTLAARLLAAAVVRTASQPLLARTTPRHCYRSSCHIYSTLFSSAAATTHHPAQRALNTMVVSYLIYLPTPHNPCLLAFSAPRHPRLQADILLSSTQAGARSHCTSMTRRCAHTRRG